MSICKGCGREIIFAKSFDNGKTIPLEVCKNAYREVADDGINPMADILESVVTKITDETIYISHFLTCKNANDFSGSKNK